VGWLPVDHGRAPWRGELGDCTGAVQPHVFGRAATREEVVRLVCRAHALTPRESEIIALVLAGLRTRTIAERLCISVNTLQDHLKAIFDKVGVRSRHELTTAGFERTGACESARRRALALGQRATGRRRSRDRRGR
jgi:DNA-binding CsgD family transcriptional regulator